MSASAAPPSEHLHPDDQTLASYSSISRWALIALALGAASPLVLVSPLLVIVPLAGVAAAIVALRGIRASDGQLLGRWPATIGLCLAVLFAGWGFSRQWTRQDTLIEHARGFVAGWLRICQEGKLQQADQLMRSADSRINSDAGIEDFYKTNKEAGEEIKTFFAREPMKSFLAAGKQSQFELSIAGQTRSGFSDEVVFRCDYRPRADEAPAGSSGPAAAGRFWVSVVRDNMPGSVAPEWRISSVEEAEPRTVRQ
jgi:hypothetical protein